jgi:hypothetical protein
MQTNSSQSFFALMDKIQAEFAVFESIGGLRKALSGCSAA